ncbi:MAG: RAD55 family ATPase [Halobacteriales archaeon]
MYDVGDSLPVEELEPAAILLTGPAMSGKYELLLDFVIEAGDHGEGSLFVTTNESAGGILSDIEDRVGEIPGALRLVDCVSEQQAAGDQFPEERVEYVNSPGDVTGLGIGVTEQLRRFAEGGTERNRIVFHSLSTLLMYSEIETVFRFLHVLTGRIDSVDGIGLFTLDPTTHEEGDVNTLRQLFDGEIEIREGEDGRELQFSGLSDTPGGWVPYD